MSILRIGSPRRGVELGDEVSESIRYRLLYDGIVHGPEVKPDSLLGMVTQALPGHSVACLRVGALG